MRKILVVLLLGVAAMMFIVGCGETKEVVETTPSTYEQTHKEAEQLRDEIIDESVSMYLDTFKELFGANFDVTKLTYNAETNMVLYEENSVSWDYVEELTYNNMVNNR